MTETTVVPDEPTPEPDETGVEIEVGTDEEPDVEPDEMEH